jgi:hypothetical protein
MIYFQTGHGCKLGSFKDQYMFLNSNRSKMCLDICTDEERFYTSSSEYILNLQKAIFYRDANVKISILAKGNYI